MAQEGVHLSAQQHQQDEEEGRREQSRPCLTAVAVQ